MQIEIKDAFDLQKIADSGQCFRVRILEDGWYRFITGSSVVYIRKDDEDTYSVTCSPEAWDTVWVPYFDLGRNYAAIEETIPRDDEFLRRAFSEGKGIRILRQDPWETLITFLMSQRKTIPAIRQSVEFLSETYGTPITTPFETVFTFPTAKQLQDAAIEDLREAKTGYRDKYILSAIHMVNEGSLDLGALGERSDDGLLTGLLAVYGVGKKVADCVALFAYGRTSLAPVDTWIRKVIDTHYGGVNPFPAYGPNAGILQQVLFFYAIGHKADF